MSKRPEPIGARPTDLQLPAGGGRLFRFRSVPARTACPPIRMPMRPYPGRFRRRHGNDSTTPAMPDHPAKRRRHWILVAVKLVIVVVVVWFIRSTIVSGWAELEKARRTSISGGGRRRWAISAGARSSPASFGTAFSGGWARTSASGRPCGRSISDTWESTCPAKRWSSFCGPV